MNVPYTRPIFYTKITVSKGIYKIGHPGYIEIILVESESFISQKGVICFTRFFLIADLYQANVITCISRTQERLNSRKKLIILL